MGTIVDKENVTISSGPVYLSIVFPIALSAAAPKAKVIDVDVFLNGSSVDLTNYGGGEASVSNLPLGNGNSLDKATLRIVSSVLDINPTPTTNEADYHIWGASFDGRSDSQKDPGNARSIFDFTYSLQLSK